jgi:hypothetical protein
MGAVRLSVDIERPIWEVFEFVTDLRHDPQWYTGVSNVRVVSDIQRGRGATYDQYNRFFGWRFESRLRVAEHDPPKHMQLCAISSAIPFTAVYSFESVGGRPWPVTRFTLEAIVRAQSVYRLLGPVLMPMLRARTRRGLRQLKHLLETQKR